MEALLVHGRVVALFYDPRISRFLQMSFKTAVTRGSFLFYQLFGRLRICRVSFEQLFCNLELDVVLLMLFSRLFSRFFFFFFFSLTAVVDLKRRGDYYVYNREQYKNSTRYTKQSLVCSHLISVLLFLHCSTPACIFVIVVLERLL